MPEEKLLEFTVTEGWEPLCSFLELPVPDVPFPKVNDSAFIARLGLILKVVIYSWIPVTVYCSCASAAVADHRSRNLNHARKLTRTRAIWFFQYCLCIIRT